MKEENKENELKESNKEVNKIIFRLSKKTILN